MSQQDSAAETHAAFTGRSSDTSGRIGGELRTEASPLLSRTPATVSKALTKAYPYFIILDKVLGVLTWTSDDAWLSVLVVAVYATLVLYFEAIITYFGHLLAVAVLVTYAVLSRHVEEQLAAKPTLDDVVQLLTAVTIKSDMLLQPISTLELTSYDIKRFLFTTVFLSPLYIVFSYFVFTPRSMLLMLGIYVLTYNSVFSRVSRKILWRFRLVRLLAFYLTGLDLGGININKNSRIFAAVQKVNAKVGLKSDGAASSRLNAEDGKPVIFTYVLYENQRRWLGIGWTPNLLSYERTAWTDEFLNESSPPDNFKLPETEEGSGLVWRWVDKTWRLDLTNDGALQLPSTKPKTTANPSIDEGYIYYDNTWKKPSTEDSFSKYTRRRRWIRTAELVPIKSTGAASTGAASSTPVVTNTAVKIDAEPVSIAQVQTVQASGTSVASDPPAGTGSTTKKRKSIKFDEETVTNEQLLTPQTSSASAATSVHSGSSKPSMRKVSFSDSDDKYD